MTNAQCIYGHRPAPGERGSGRECRPSWREDLCPVWLDLVVAPRSFRVFRDHEIAARRVVGHDGNDIPCFQAYDYRRLDVRSDDDEEYYLAVAYSESSSAWRLASARRTLACFPSCRPARRGGRGDLRAEHRRADAALKST
jgi:hypothetical protein